MNKMKITVLAFLLFAGVNLMQAQDEQNKWALSFGINAVDVNQGGLNDIGGTIKDYLETGDWNVLPAISTISISRYLNYGLSVKASGSLNKIYTAQVKDDVEAVSFFALSAAAVYDLNSWFGETGWFDPYAQFGLGATWIGDTSAFTIKPGVGFNTWFNESIGLNFDTSFNYGTSEFREVSASNYFQHSVSLILKFGGPSKKDADGDGVADEYDACIDTAGTKENGGCPDTDGDGVLDKDDACVNTAGTLENRGCPDADGDGVLDKEDACPNAAGTVENGGCPDTDGDGVIDSKDLCPELAGPIENNGCAWPDTDEDGIADKDDECPEVKGTIEKKGCPELTEIQLKKLGEFSKTIGFNSGKVTFKAGVSDKLDGLAKVMLQYPTTKFVINGYTDNTGSKARNLEVSKLRAKAVKDYLVSKGIDERSLESQGYGVESPISSNKTTSGRKENRRVEIIAQ